MAFATRRNPNKDRPLLALAPLAWYTDIDGDSPIGNKKKVKDERIELFHTAVEFIITSRGQPPESCSQTLDKLTAESFSCMAIEKDRFSKWCLATGYKLPRFWFSDELTVNSKSPLNKNATLDSLRLEASKSVAKAYSDGKSIKEIALNLYEVGYKQPEIFDLFAEHGLLEQKVINHAQSLEKESHKNKESFERYKSYKRGKIQKIRNG